jgi:hypothetical protein
MDYLTLPFSQSIRIALDGGTILENAPLVWRTPTIEVHGRCHINAFTQVSVVEDSSPGSPIALVGLVQTSGNSGVSSGPIQTVGFGIAGVQKLFTGPGTYSFPLCEGTGPLNEDGWILGITSYWELRAVGSPQGRILGLRIDGTLVTGNTNSRKWRDARRNR